MTIERVGGVKTGSGGQALPFSQACVAGGFVFVSGQVGMNSDGEIVTGGLIAETHQAFRNMTAILEKCGCSLADVVKATVWLDDPRDFAAFNRIYASYFPAGFPARSCVASPLMVDAKVEIEVVAFKPAR